MELTIILKQKYTSPVFVPGIQCLFHPSNGTQELQFTLFSSHLKQPLWYISWVSICCLDLTV